jgi:ferric-dicitrate binding protein FerR (iron transport regulator)
MDINGFEKVVQRYLNGQATDDDLVLIEQWFQQTDANNYQLTEERKKIIAGRLLPRLNAITAGGTDTSVKPINRLRTFPNRFTRIAAALIIMAAAGLGWMFRYQLQDIIAPVAQQTVKAGPYEIKRVQLPDQTMVTLNTGASITFPTTWRRNRRITTLEGEAFFEVAKNEQPFIVHTNSVDVTVLGTSFVVKEQPAVSTVSVVTGKVKVTAGQQALAELRPGRQVSYDTRSGKATLQPFDVQQVMVWTQHSLSFTAIPLEQVLRTIAEKWNVRLDMPAAASGKQFSGDFASDDSLDDMLTALALTTGIHWERTAAGAISITYP